MQQAARLSFDMRGPSWLDADGAPVFTYYEEPGTTAGRYWSGRPSSESCYSSQLELVVLHWFERMELSERHDGKHPQVQLATEVGLGRT